MIFVDTGIWYARFVADDPNHLHVKEWFKSNSSQLITSDYCVDETLTLISARKRPDLALVAGRHMFDETMAHLLFLNNGQIYRAWILVQQRASAGWSFTDCTSKVVIEDLALQAAASLDQHFHQFGIEVLP